MNHKFIHNDNGLDCYRDGLSVDLPWMGDEPSEFDEDMDQEIRFLLPNCNGPSEGIAHHFYAIGSTDGEHSVSAIECHYGDAHIGWETDLAYVPRFCKGD